MPNLSRKDSFSYLAFTMLIFAVFLSSCARDKYDEEELYNSVGFDPGTSPAIGQNSAKSSPDYFYRQPQSGAGQQYQPQYPTPQYQVSPYPAQYYQPSPYQVYPNAGSRFYSNPYAIPPSPYYQQYDVDQYYVPPTYSYGMEQSGVPRNTTISR